MTVASVATKILFMPTPVAGLPLGVLLVPAGVVGFALTASSLRNLQTALREPTEAEINKVRVTYGSGVRVLDPWEERQLQIAGAKAGISVIPVTSTVRTYADQARAMYGLIVNEVAAQKELGKSESAAIKAAEQYGINLYATGGKAVVRVICNGLRAKLDRTTILLQAAAEVEKQTKLGFTVSQHVQNSKYKAIDIGPQTGGFGTRRDDGTIRLNSKGERLVTAFRSMGTVRKVIPPPKDPAIHVELLLSKKPKTLSGMRPARGSRALRLSGVAPLDRACPL